VELGETAIRSTSIPVVLWMVSTREDRVGEAAPDACCAPTADVPLFPPDADVEKEAARAPRVAAELRHSAAWAASTAVEPVAAVGSRAAA
jgi:hypothetical protein